MALLALLTGRTIAPNFILAVVRRVNRAEQKLDHPEIWCQLDWRVLVLHFLLLLLIVCALLECIG